MAYIPPFHVGDLSHTWRSEHRCRQKYRSISINLPQPINAIKQQSVLAGQSPPWLFVALEPCLQAPLEWSGGRLSRCFPCLWELLLSRSCILSLTELCCICITGMSASSLILSWSGPVDLASWLDWDLPHCWGFAGCSLYSYPTPSAHLAWVLWLVRLLPWQPFIALGSQLLFPAEQPALAASWYQRQWRGNLASRDQLIMPICWMLFPLFLQFPLDLLLKSINPMASRGLAPYTLSPLNLERFSLKHSWGKYRWPPCLTLANPEIRLRQLK